MTAAYLAVKNRKSLYPTLCTVANNDENLRMAVREIQSKARLLIFKFMTKIDLNHDLL